MALPQQTIEQIRAELDALNDEWKDAGKCYHFETSPPHVLFNLNCPDGLQSKVRSILSKYTGTDESSAQ